MAGKLFKEEKQMRKTDFLLQTKDPNDWLTNSQGSSRSIPSDNEDLRKAAVLLLPHKLLSTVLERSITEHGIEFILRIRDMRNRFSSVSVKVSSSTADAQLADDILSAEEAVYLVRYIRTETDRSG